MPLTLLDKMACFQALKHSFDRSMILDYTVKNAKVATSLLTSHKSLTNKPILACVRMPCDSLVTTGLLQFGCQVSASCNNTANDKLQQA